MCSIIFLRATNFVAQVSPSLCEQYIYVVKIKVMISCVEYLSADLRLYFRTCKKQVDTAQIVSNKICDKDGNHCHF